MANGGFHAALFLLGIANGTMAPPVPPVVTVISHGWFPPGKRQSLDLTDLMDEMERLRRKRQLRREEEEELVLIA